MGLVSGAWVIANLIVRSLSPSLVTLISAPLPKGMYQRL
jgi:hypothetical protein